MAELLQARLSGQGIESQIITGATEQSGRMEMINQLGTKGRILICTDTMGYGVNLDQADILVNFDLPWNPARLKQREDRIHRINSTRQKTIINLIGDGIEQRVWEIIGEKKLLFDKVVDGEAIEDVNIRDAILKKVVGV